MEIKDKYMKKADTEKQQLACALQKQGCGGCPMLALPYEEQLRKKNKETAGEFRKTSANYWHGKSLALPEQGNLYLYLCQGETGEKRDLCPGNPLGNTCGDLSFASAGSGRSHRGCAKGRAGI